MFAVPEPQPRAWLVGRARVADGEAAIRVLLDPAFDPRREAIVATPAPLEPGSQLETDSPHAALLMLADAYDPGWRASVDGAHVAVLRGNVAFRAVPVPSGRHRVELVYRPRAVVGGLAVSGIAAAVAFGLLVASRRRLRWTGGGRG